MEHGHTGREDRENFQSGEGTVEGSRDTARKFNSQCKNKGVSYYKKNEWYIAKWKYE